MLKDGNGIAVCYWCKRPPGQPHSFKCKNPSAKDRDATVVSYRCGRCGEPGHRSSERNVRGRPMCPRVLGW